MSMATFNASTFAALDIIYFSAQGGVYGTAATLPSSGNDASNVITYSGLADGTGGSYPVISLSGTALTISQKSYIVVSGFSLTNTSAAGASSVLRISGSTASSGLTIQNMTLSCPNSASGYGINASCPYTSVVFDNLTVSAAYESVYSYGNPSSDFTVKNCTSTSGGGVAGGIHLRYVTNITIKKNTISAPGASAIYLQNCAGTLDQADNTITASGGNGAIYFTTCTLSGTAYGDVITGATTSGVEMTTVTGPLVFYGTTVTGATGNGFRCLTASSGISFIYCSALSGAADGFVTSGNSHDITFRYCRAIGNGDKTSTAAGDGFTSHENDYNIFVEYCVAAFNTITGFAMINTSSGHVWNSIAYQNGGNWSLEGGGKQDQVRGGFYFPLSGLNPTTGTGWSIKNCIGMNNYPRELWLHDIVNGYVVADYNLYYPLDAAKLASIDNGVTNVSWATYHTTNSQEPHSLNADPKFSNAANYKFNVNYDSPCIDAGVDLGSAYRYGLDKLFQWDQMILLYAQGTLWDIGAYPYRSGYIVDHLSAPAQIGGKSEVFGE